MKIRKGRIFKFLSTLIGVIVAVLVIFIAAVSYFCNDEKIREFISVYSDENLTVDIDAGEFQLKPFSRFPSMTLAVKDLVITSEKVKDSLYVPTAEDTLLTVKQADIAMSALPLFVGKFVFAGVFVDSIYANYTIYEDSTSNWDMFIEEANVDTLDIAVDSTGEASIAGLSIKQFLINNANIVYDDRTTKSSFAMNNGKVQLRGGMSSDRGLFIDVDFDADKLDYIENNISIVKDLSLGVQGKLFVRNDTSAIRLSKTKVRINDISLSCDGSILADTTVENGALLDLRYSVDLPELNELWRLVPEHHATYMKDMSVTGMIECNGSIYGPLNENQMPHIDGFLKSDDISFRHKDLPGSIDTLDIDVLLDFDMNDPKCQYVVVNDFNLVGSGLNLRLNGQVTELMSDPNIQLGAKVSVNAEEMLTLFPDTLGVVANGDINGMVRTSFHLSDIENSNYGKVKASGFISVPNFTFELPTDSIVLHIDSASMFLGSGVTARRTTTSVQRARLNELDITPLSGSIRWKGFEASLKRGHVFKTDSLRLSLRTMQIKDTSAIIPFSVGLMWQNLRAERYDTTWFSSKYMSLNARISGARHDKHIPHVVVKLNTDSLLFTPFRNRLAVNNILVDVDAYSSGKRVLDWNATSQFKVSDMSLYTNYYPLQIESKSFSLTTDTSSLTISAPEIKIGRSDLALDGKVYNVWNWLWSDDSVAMKLDVHSKRLYVNQLLVAMDEGNAYKIRLDSIFAARRDSSAMLKAEASAEIALHEDENVQVNDEMADTTSTIKLNHVFVLPDKYRIDCNLVAERMAVAKWRVSDANAKLNLNDGVLKVSEMSVKSRIGDILARGLYTAEDTTKAFAGFAMSMDHVQIGDLINVVPQFDTMMPMLSSLSGNVNLDIAVAGNWDQDMTVDMNSLTGAACIDGTDLVLMDGETFSMIAKKLKFKNRKRNMIDSLSVSMMLDDGVLRLYPFALQMDRYKVAVGGKQNMDMTFKYHVSILESPLPFKFGLTISGDMEDMKFKITKALYKDLLKPTSEYNVKKIRLDLKDKISDFLENISDQSYALPKFDFYKAEQEIDNEETDKELEQALENYSETE